MTGSNIMIIVKMILATLPFSLLCVVYSRSNLAKEYRGHQFLSVVFGVFYSVITLIFFSKMEKKLVEFIAGFIKSIYEFGVKHPQISTQANSVADYLKNVDWNIYIIFILNTLLLLAFIIIKRILLIFFKKLWSNEDIYSATSGTFYEWVGDISRYFLKDKYYAVKKIFKVYFILTCIIVSILLMLIKLYPNWEGFRTVVYPYLSIIIIGELFFFIDGITQAEYVSRVGGDDGSSRVKALYYPFKKYLNSLFGNYIIGDKTKFPKFNYAHSNSDIVKKYENQDSQESMLVNVFFTKKYSTRNKVQSDLDELVTSKSNRGKLKLSGIDLDESLVDATAKLMNGESVLFLSPFYNDYSDYIFLPLNRALTKGSKVLVLVCRNGIEDHIKQWMSDSLEQVINVPEMWKIDYLNDKECFTGEVGIVAASSVMNVEILNKNVDFIKDVTEVVMIEPSKFITTAQVSLSVYVSNLSDKAVYYMFDKNSDGLVDTMSHIIKQSIVDVTPSVSQRNISTYLMWKADGEQFSNRLFPSVARYLGEGTELIISALREQIKKGEWFSFNKFPIYEMKWISQQYYKVLCEYATIPVRQEELENRMLFNHDLWGSQKRDYQYLVIEDEFCNLFEMARQFESRSKKESFINIISQNYLLREYMYLNPELFESDPKAIPPLIADFVRTHRNIAIELLLKLQAGFVQEKEIVKVLRYLGNDVFFGTYSTYDVKNALHELISRYFNNFESSSPECFIDERDRYYRLHHPKKDSSSYKALALTLDELRSVYYILEDEEDHSNYLESKLYGQVYQSHLPGQHIVIKGKYYEILFIGSQNGVVLKRAGDHIHAREYYRQLRKYNLKTFEPCDCVGTRSSFGNIIFEEGNADFDVETSGYLLMKDYGDFHHECFKKLINGIPDRNYKQKSIIRLTLPGITHAQRMTITTVLNEVFKTIYPDDCDFICALTSLNENVSEGLLYDFDYAQGDDQSEYIYIVEDSVLDMGLLASFKSNFRRIFEIVTDYLEWHEEMLKYKPKPKFKLTSVIDVPPIPPVPPAPQKKGIIQKVKDWFKIIFKKNKQDEPQNPEGAQGGVSTEQTEHTPVEFVPKDDTSVFPIWTESLAKKALNENQKKCYDQILEHIRAYDLVFSVAGSIDDSLLALKTVKEDYPEFFWLSCPYSATGPSDGTSSEVTIKSFFTKDEFIPMYEQLLQKVDSIIAEINSNVQGSAYKSSLAAHDYIVDNCEYDFEGFKLAQKKEETLNLSSTAYGCIIDGKAICSGYAAAYQLLMNRLGAECGITTGADHAWNYIRIDDDYYYIDVTWDDPVSDNKVEENDFDTSVSHEFFCITKEELLKTHSLDEKTVQPEAKSTNYNYFVRENLFMERYNLESTKQIILSSLSKAKIELKFGSEEELQVAKNDLIDNGKLNQIVPSLNSIRYYSGKSKQTLYFIF